ncbi:MAG: DUF2911 domain-containing protein [Bacteroidota bacterium]
MKRALSVLCLLTAALAASAAGQTPILSPRDSVFLTLDTNTISVNYGRPSMRGRKIMGHLVPWDQVWRTGANQATHLKTSFDMVFGGMPVPRGTYTLWTLPSPAGWKVIVNKQTRQWGTAYDPSLDLCRFEARVERLAAPVDTFTIALQTTGASSGVMKLLWEQTSVIVPFERSTRIRPISPADSSELSLAGRKVLIKYSRPFMRGRVIWGVVVPFDSVWRTGANLATSLATESDLTLGGIRIPKGSYTLYSIPSASGFTLIVNRRPGGTEPEYDPHLDLARISMKQETASTPVDPFRIWFEPAGSGRATLKLGWSGRIFSAQLNTN